MVTSGKAEGAAPSGTGSEAPAAAAQDAFESLPDAMLIARLDGVVVAANAAARLMFGRHMIGETISDFLPGGPTAAAPGAAPGWRILDVRTASGMRSAVRTQAWRLQSTEPLIAHRVKSLQPTPADERAGRQLAAIVQSSQDAIISKSLDGIILSWNPAASRMYGYSETEALGQHILMLFPPDRRHEEAEILSRVRAGERVESYESVRLRKDGSRVDVALTVSPILDADDQVIAASTIARDITKRKQRDALLERQREELARSNAALERFAYVASHDLQEPLRMVASYTQLLQRRYQGRLDQDADEFIGYAVDGARRMQALINDVLAYSRVARGAMQQVPCDLDACLSRALMSLQGAIADTGATIHRAPLPTVPGDPTQLTQVLQNLVGNAIKFRGESPPEVAIDAVKEDGFWHFSVKDNGIGIEPEYAERIFGIFQRLHAAGQYAGTGIGLAICAEVVERHGGRIWVESTPGKGSTFHFTLPANREVLDRA